MGKFDERNAEGPDIGFDGIVASLYPFGLDSDELEMEWVVKPRTLMYIDVPTKELAMELISSPETPKSQSLISPQELRRILEGFISRWIILCTS